MTPDRPEQMLDALSAPLGDLIAEVGRSVAEAQKALDAATIDNVRALAAASGPDDPDRLLRQIGYQPTWYQIPEVTAEITVALALTGSGETSGKSSAPRMRMMAAPVDASYASRYNYELKAASSLKFRIVPVPPSPTAERMRVVPKVVGLTLADARARLADADVRFRLADELAHADDAVVASQQPEPGELLTGGAVTLGF
ncbi:MAG: PASTA domain-containing protein [Myxococcales bacterium]|nr:PASTA domain-containing protein [Myxococcales bacterium]